MIGQGVDSFSSHSCAAGRTTFSANSWTHFWTSRTSSDISRLYSAMRLLTSSLDDPSMVLPAVTYVNQVVTRATARGTEALITTAAPGPAAPPRRAGLAAPASARNSGLAAGRSSSVSSAAAPDPEVDPGAGDLALTRPATRSGRSQARRLSLLEAADRVVRRSGPEASMAAIAAEAGISKPVVYRHFGDKGGLYRALADRHISDLMRRLQAALRRPADRRERTRLVV